jgi:hypothetical protein
MTNKALNKELKTALIVDLLRRLLPAYDDRGYTVEEYYNDIILPELTSQELSWLKEAADGNLGGAK